VGHINTEGKKVIVGQREKEVFQWVREQQKRKAQGQMIKIDYINVWINKSMIIQLVTIKDVQQIP
jgi:disulfide oxidoreductase YuzD